MSVNLRILHLKDNRDQRMGRFDVAGGYGVTRRISWRGAPQPSSFVICVGVSTLGALPAIRLSEAPLSHVAFYNIPCQHSVVDAL
ncbi:MAG: hypothetical protein ABI837_17455 [Acidobacteriota bacterium]